MTPRRTRSLRLPGACLAAALLLAVAASAAAGGLDPELAARLAALPRGDRLPVIVELIDQADPHAAAALHAGRRARAAAVVAALQDTAARTQGPLRAYLAREQALGHATRALPLWVVNAIAVTADPAVIRALAARGDVRAVRLDRAIPPPAPIPAEAGPSTAPAEWNIDQIRAPEVWAIDPSYTGVGAVVGSFDTGVDVTHPDLAPRYRGDDAISWFDPYGEHATPVDNDAHGTHTTGTMVGGDAGGTSIGVAPGARWIAAKAWDDSGNGFVSAFHQIFQWFLAPGGDPANAPDVVNMSWGFAESGCLTDFLSDIRAFRAAGIFPAVAAGNTGPFPGSVSSPGAYPESVTVGATDVLDGVADFSGRGPSPCDGGIKPSLAAPGDGVTSAVPGGFYLTFSGTSMATPHVAGAVAVLRAIAPDLTVDELEDLLVRGAVDLAPAGPDDDSGAGRLDLFQSAQIALGGGGPDQPHVTIAATTATATEAGPRPGVLTVTRSGPTTADLTVAYTASGTATPGSDYVALPGTVVIPSGATTATIVVTPIDDSLVELDESVVVSLRFDPSYFVGNPGKATVTIVSDEIPPDLVVSALTVPAGAAAGDALAVTDTTTNRGGGPADPSVTRFYLSTDAAVDAGDVLLGGRAVPALAPGASHVATTSVGIPAGTAPGAYYLLAVADGDQALVESAEDDNLAARPLAVGPDLVVSAFAPPAAVGAGVAFSVTETTKNAGAAPAAASTTRFYLSADPAWDASDTALGSRAVPALAAGATSSGTTTLTVPAGTAGGLYYLIARADADAAVPESNEGNNALTALVRVGPDLAVAGLSVPAGGGAGGAITVTETTRNQGGGAAPASTTRFYLSTDYSWSASDTPLGSRAVPALAPGAGSSASTVVTIPAGTPAGPYYVLARADADQTVAEADETNNVAAYPISLGPDLVIAALSVPASASAGDTITVGDTVANQGAGSAGASTTRFFLSADGVLDASDVALGGRAVPSLAPGASSSGTTALTLPATVAVGSYYLFAKADGDDAVAEIAEANNRGFGMIQIGADLVVSALSAPRTGGAGGAVAIADTTKNQAGGSAPASTTRFYLSADAVWDAGDAVLGSRAVPALAAGAASSASTTVTLPAGTPAGSYWVLARADADGVVGETQEGNNTAAVTILIGPDLVVAALGAPGAAGAGSAVGVSDTTKNQGAGAAGGSTTRFYLSADAVLDAGDLPLGSRAVAPLGAGASQAGSTTVTIPAGTATGTWYLIGRADADGVVGETVESNNTSAAVILIGGDLAIAALSVPATAGAGATIAVGDTTANQGAGAVGGSTTRFYLSADTALDAGDLVLGSRAVPALAGGSSHSATTTLTLPAGLAGGTWYVIAKADADGVVPETFETNNGTARSIVIGADLVVGPFTGPPTAGAGAPVSVTETTRNQGGAPAGGSTTAFYLSADTALDGGDAWLGSRVVPALAVGASSTATTALTLPAGLAPGTYYLLARADADQAVPETNEANNTTYAVIRVGPDLVVSALSAPAAGAGATVTVGDTTRNQGGGAGEASTTGFWLSTNPALDAGDVFLGSRAVPALAAGAGHSASTALTIPAGTPAGVYYLIAAADAGGVVAESQEGNNAVAVALTVGGDLTVAWITGPGLAGAGQTITVTEATRNAGGGAVDASTTAFYLSTNASLDAGDVLLGSRPVPALAGGASSTASTALVIPAGLAPGGYYLLARADADGAVTESQEANNVNYTGLLVGPDLALFAPSAPTSAAAGATITVSDTTRNGGGGAAGASTTRFYLSANPVWDAADAAIGARPVPALAPGATSAASTAVVVPPGTAPGTWYLIGRADADGAVAESNEVNNTSYTTIQVTP